MAGYVVVRPKRTSPTVAPSTAMTLSPPMAGRRTVGIRSTADMDSSFDSRLIPDLLSQHYRLAVAS